MAEYIERTEELMLALNAGARAIENTKRYHGAVYTKDVFSESPQEIPYLLAAKVLREASDAPAADVAPVVRCRDCKYFMEYTREYAQNADGADGDCYIRVMNSCNEQFRSCNYDDFCSYGERKEGAEC